MSIRSALAYSFTAKYAAFVMQFASSVAVARILSPREIGVYSVGAAVIMVAQTLRDFGTSNYLIQERELTDSRIRTAFTLTVTIATSMALLIWLLSDSIAVFYGEPDVAEVMKVMALNFALIPLGSVTLALLKRNMNFRATMFISIASTAVHSGTSVLLAAAGFGFISLAWAAVCGTATTVVGAAVASRRWIFTRPSVADFRRVIGFGFRSSSASIAAEAGHASPDLVLGKSLGMEATGLFGRALGFAQLFERLLQDVLKGVLLPYFAAEVRSGENVRAKVALAADNIASIMWFVLSLAAILAEPSIQVIYGSQWTDAVPAAHLLCFGIALRCLAPMLGAALIAHGRVNDLLRVTLWSTSLKFVALICLSPLGLQAAAAGFISAEALAFAYLMHTAQKAGLYSLSDFGRTCQQAALPVFAGLITALLIVEYWTREGSFQDDVALILIAGSAALIAWIIVLKLTNHPTIREIDKVISSTRLRFARPKSERR